MLSDPQSITVNSVAKLMPCTSRGEYTSIYKMADDEFGMRVSHSFPKGRERHMVRVDQTKMATDPFTSVQFLASLGVYLVIDQPKTGFSDAEIVYVVNALCAWLTASSSAATLKVLGNES